MRSAIRSAIITRKSPADFGPFKASRAWDTSWTAMTRRYRIVMIRCSENSMRMATMSSGSAPGLQFTPRRIKSSPSSVSMLRGRESSLATYTVWLGKAKSIPSSLNLFRSSAGFFLSGRLFAAVPPGQQAAGHQSCRKRGYQNQGPGGLGFPEKKPDLNHARVLQDEHRKNDENRQNENSLECHVLPPGIVCCPYPFFFPSAGQRTVEKKARWRDPV